MCPFVGYNRPSSILTVVDLPDPFGPSKPKTSPRRTSKSTLSTARALGRPQKSLKTLVRPRTETTTSLDCDLLTADRRFCSATAIKLRDLRRQFRRRAGGPGRGFGFGMIMLQLFTFAHQTRAVKNHD